MRKRLIAIALTACFAPAIAQQPSDAQVVPAGQAIAACSANPYVCAVVVGTAGTWVLWNAGAKLWCTYGQCVPREYRSGAPRNDDTGKQAETQKLVTNYDGCRDMERRFQGGGFRLKVIRIEKNNAPGSYYPWVCIIAGDSREIARFGKYWR